MEPEFAPIRLGDLLRGARLARGIFIMDAEEDTRIRRVYLEAIEADDISDLPAPVFTRGLVGSYARYLGIDPSEALQLLSKLEERDEGFGVVSSVEGGPVLNSESEWVPRTILIVVAGLIIGLVIFFILPRFQDFMSALTFAIERGGVSTSEAASVRSSILVTPTEVPRPIVSASPITASILPTNTPVPSPTLPPAAIGTETVAASIRGVTAEIRVLGRVWAQFEVDNQVTFAGIMAPGERRVVRAERKITAHVGDGALVEATVNGRSLGPVGPAGEVVRLEWTSQRS